MICFWNDSPTKLGPFSIIILRVIWCSAIPMWIIQFKLWEPLERVLKAKLCFLSAQEILV